MTESNLKVLDLFSGAGGFTLAGELAGGYDTVAFCEIDKYAIKVLNHNWPSIPVHQDVTKLGVKDFGKIDVITGGFPCQDLSSAGKGKGIGDGTRSGLFREMVRLAKEVKLTYGKLPYIVFENVPRLLSGPAEEKGEWFGEFLWSLAEIGYDAEWFCITAASIGAPHYRERICIATYPHQASFKGRSLSSRVYQKHALLDGSPSQWGCWGGGEQQVHRMDDGLSKRSHSIRSGIMGNALVPQVFSIILSALYEFDKEIKGSDRD